MCACVCCAPVCVKTRESGRTRGRKNREGQRAALKTVFSLVRIRGPRSPYDSVPGAWPTHVTATGAATTACARPRHPVLRAGARRVAAHAVAVRW